MTLRVGVDVTPLRPPYTGVGNYALGLLDALLPVADGVTFQGFRRLHWVDVDAAFLAACKAAAAKTGPSPEAGRARTSRIRSALGAAERIVRRPRITHAAAAALRGAVFARSLAGRRIDLFHAFVYRAPVRHARVPVLPLVYDLSHVRHPEFHPASRVRWMQAVEEECRRAPMIHVISEFTAREVETFFGVRRDLIHVVPPAVGDVFRDPAAWEGGVLHRLGLAPGGYALTVSTLEPRKNLATLLDAHGRLDAAARARLPLVVVGGSGWGGVDLGDHPLVRSGAVRLAGYVTDAELAALYGGARAMLYPSIYEGYGMPVIEALATGTYVVASDAASMPEALGGQGGLVAPMDVDGWTAAMRRALDDDTLQEPVLREARIAHVRAWTWHDAALRVRAMYAALAAG